VAASSSIDVVQMTALSNRSLFAMAVLIWGTTWYAILFQIGHSTPELGVAYRFALAGLAVLAFARFQGQRLNGSLAAHGLLALQGVFMYSLSYLCVYHAELHVPSGLVAVGYSVSPLIAGVAAWALWKTPLSQRFLWGGALGAAGVVLIFWLELGAAARRPKAGAGLMFTVGAVALSAVGSLAASRNGRFNLAFWPAMGTALMYGALCSFVVLLVMGQSLVPPTAPAWWLSLAYLSIAGTVLAFGAFLTLQQRLGPGKAATVGVMTPVLALAVSTALEAYRPELFTFAGVALAVLGNWLMLKQRPADGSAGRGKSGPVAIQSKAIP
jgi:drug/metabolite transporter (DMT)-like permease